mmetsp:Transcript_19453/g.26400  ORF Transcript_19453/g.26400 Transcript_19453/m.26400 type:complete len:86 (+) Transcript_19453:136-393(+)
MGSEAEGISMDLKEAADERIMLPMHGFAQSLNVSVATALVLQVVLSMAGPSCRGDLDQDRKDALRHEWTTRLCAPGHGRRHRKIT